MTTHRQFVYVRAPEGMPDAGYFRVVEAMIGRGAGIVIESRHPDFRVGDPVQGEFGWREHVALDARDYASCRPTCNRARLASASSARRVRRPWSGSSAKRSSSRRRPARSAALPARSRASRAGAPSASPAEPKSAGMSSPISASTPASITRRDRSGPRSPRRRAASMCIFDNVGGDMLDAVLPCLNIHARGARQHAVRRQHR
jgi:hypothetical protein